MKKRLRHEAILRLVREQRLGSQEALAAALGAVDIEAAQATISRDIRELGLTKVTDPSGGAFYALPADGIVRPQLAQVLPPMLRSVEGAGPLVVLRTAAGAAGLVRSALDQAGWPELLGAVATEDTVLLVLRNDRVRPHVIRRLAAFLR